MLGVALGVLLVCRPAVAQDSRQPTACDGAPPDETSALIQLLIDQGPEGVDHLLTCLEVRSAAERSIWVDALARVPSFATERLQHDIPHAPEVRALVLDVVRHVGKSSDLAHAYGAAFDAAAGEPLVELLPALQTASEQVLARGSYRALSTLDDLFDDLDASRQLTLIKAVGNQPSIDTLELLAALLDRSDSMTVMLLSQLSRVAGVVNVVPSQQALLRVRARLRAREAGVRREAALALGKLYDYESVPALIELLADENSGTSGNALWSLYHITGKNLELDVDRWTRWFQVEGEWWASSTSDLFDKLRSSDDAQVVAALNEIGRKRLFRDELAFEVAGTLEHPNADVVRLACSVLTSLRSRVPYDGLVFLLEHSDQAVQEAALRALRAITGRELPGDASAWQRASD